MVLKLLLAIISQLDHINFVKEVVVNWKYDYIYALAATIIVSVVGCGGGADIDTEIGRRYSPPIAEVYTVISSDAPGWMRVGGPGRYLCDGTADNVEIQAAIDAATADGYSVVELSTGPFAITTPLYIGYAAGEPNANGGCSLKGTGTTSITWAGTTQDAPNVFLLHVAPQSFSAKVWVENISFFCESKISGIYSHSLVRGGIKNVVISGAKYFGLIAAESWTGRFEKITVSDCEGVAVMGLRNNGARFEQIFIGPGDVSNMPDLMKYSTSSGVSTLQPLETVTVTTGNGDKSGYFLGRGMNPENLHFAVFAHDGSGDFANGNVATGDESAGKTTLTTISYDIRSTIYTEGTDCFFSQFYPEGNVNGDTIPFMLIHGHSTVCEGFRFESGGSQKNCETYFKIEEADGVIIRNCEVRGNADLNGTLTSGETAVDGGGAGDGTITFVDTGFLAKISVDDEIYLWDADGATFTEQVFTVLSKVGSVVTFVEEIDANSTGATTSAYNITDVDRETPLTCVEIIDAYGTIVENMYCAAFRGDLVTVDANCRNTSVRNLVYDTNYALLTSDTFWLAIPNITGYVANAGLYTTFENPQVWATSGLSYTGPTLDANSRITLAQAYDGPEVASNAALPIGSAWGPGYKVYVTGEVAATSVTGGYIGQVITLIATHANGFTVTDGAGLDVGDGNVVLAQWETITLICNAAAGNSWRVVGIEAYL